jgi:hypothetical protein
LIVPRFAERSELVRYISEENRLSKERPAAAAFLPDPPSATPKKDYLSVNSLEVESIAEIASYHRAKWQRNEGKVALAAHKVSHYTDTARKCGIAINYDRQSGSWYFQDGNSQELAYKHHPVLGSERLQSPSHCGIEFSRGLKGENDKAKFARRLAGQRFHTL